MHTEQQGYSTYALETLVIDVVYLSDWCSKIQLCHWTEIHIQSFDEATFESL